MKEFISTINNEKGNIIFKIHKGSICYLNSDIYKASHFLVPYSG